MSNLSTTVKFDVLRGWPNGSAIEESFKFDSTEAVPEGVFVQLNAGTPGAVQLAVDSLAGTKYRLVIQGNDQYDAKFARKVVTLRGPMTIQTEKYSGVLAVGDKVCVSTAGPTQGYLVKPVAAEQVVGEVEEVGTDFIVVALDL